jgi:vacuole membrane protein 1
LFVVQAEAMLWGLGTAIGELPPYFIARAARLAGQSLEDLEEDATASWLARTAQRVLLRLGFIGILLFAAVWRT